MQLGGLAGMTSLTMGLTRDAEKKENDKKSAK
jgi:hypothetical protein